MDLRLVSGEGRDSYSSELNPTGLVAVTTDNGSNVVKAPQLTKRPGMQCFSHSVFQAIDDWQY